MFSVTQARGSGSSIGIATALVFALALPASAQDPAAPDTTQDALAQEAEAEGPPSTPSRAFRTQLGGHWLMPFGEQLGSPLGALPVSVAPERTPSGRAFLSIQSTPTFGVQFGAMRLAGDRVNVEGSRPLEEQFAVTAGLFGFRFNITKRRVRIGPFFEGGGGLMQAMVDEGGYDFVGGYQQNWTRVEGPVFGGGAGLELDLIVGPGLTLSGTGGYWHFQNPDEAIAPINGVFAGAGVKLSFKSNRWYWRTSGRDQDGPRLMVLDPEPTPAGVIDIGQDEGTVQILVADLSGVQSVRVAGQDADLAKASRDQVEQAGLYGSASVATARVRLNPGTNTVRLVAVDEAGNEMTQDFEILGVPIDEEPPTIALLSPQPGEAFDSARVRVVGVAADNGDITEVRVNGIAARTEPASLDDRVAANVTDMRPAYRFTANVALTQGENRLRITAVDTMATQELLEITIQGPAPAPVVVEEPEPEPPPTQRPIIDIAEPASWAVEGVRGINIVPRQSLRVRGTVRYPQGITEVLVDGTRASLVRDPSGVRVDFTGFVPVTEENRDVMVQARGTDGALTSRVFSVYPTGQPPAGPASFGTFANASQRQRWAIVIGISEYEDDRIPDLDYADDDANEIYEFLRSPRAGLGGIPEENIRFLVNEDATERNIRTALLNFLRNSTEDDVIMVYIAGHGLPDPVRPDDLYLLAHDTDMDNLPVTAIDMTLVQDAVQRAFSYNTIVITDACHSAGVGVGTRTGLGTNAINEIFLDRMLGSQGGLVTFTASETNQLSQESEQWGGGHGVFTHFLLEGLGGEADENGDQIVDLGELMEYTRDQVRRATQNAQVPTISQTPYDRFWPMANLGVPGAN